jgi:lipopolysaccharide export system permease protein
LGKNIDSLTIVDDSLQHRQYATLNGFMHFSKINDSIWQKATISSKKISRKQLFPDSAKSQVFGRAYSMAADIKNTIQFYGFDAEGRETNIRLHKIEWHRKYSFSVACLVLFFIGAPLGSIIRKGGLGMPLVVAIIFFLIFHLLGMFGEKFVRGDLTSPFLGMWLSVLVLTPVGIFLTYKAMNDSQLFNKEIYLRFIKKIQILLHSFKEKRIKTSQL